MVVYKISNPGKAQCNFAGGEGSSTSAPGEETVDITPPQRLVRGVRKGSVEVMMKEVMKNFWPTSSYEERLLVLSITPAFYSPRPASPSLPELRNRI